MLAAIGALVGCGTAKEKTAPCKRPANVLSYASVAGVDKSASGCGPLLPVNSDPNAADKAIDVLTAD